MPPSKTCAPGSPRCKTPASWSPSRAPTVTFQDIPGFPPRHRVVANILTSVRRINLTLGMPADTSEMDLVRYWRNYMKNPETIPPVTVESGSLMENVATGVDIDIL